MNGKTSKAPRTGRLGHIRAQLLARERRLVDGLRDVEHGGVWTTGADAMEAASESVANDLMACLMELRTGELLEINDAFQKLHDGTYGRCENCEKRIPAARLRLVPAVSLCVDCKRDIERRSDNSLGMQGWGGAEAMADEDKAEPFSGQTRRRS